MPCEIIVDYRATMGLFLERASRTRWDIFKIDGQILCILVLCYYV